MGTRIHTRRYGKSGVVALTSVVVLAAALIAPAAAQIPRPVGVYVVNEASNEQSTATAYVQGLTTSAAYRNDVTGHAIFVPIAKILPSVTTWGQFNWDWTYLDTLVQIAAANGKQFSVELETGFQSSGSYAQSLPAGFAAACGADCAPLFDVWATGGSGGRCISAYVLLPWNAKVQQFWAAAASALAAHLHQAGSYGSLTLVHVPGLSVYDEEIRLPTGSPAPASTDTSTCPDGRPSYPTTIDDASNARWQSLGYSDAAVINGFDMIATAFAQAFPDRYLGLSLFPRGAKGIDFPNLTNDAPGYVAGQLVQGVTAIAPGRVQVQADQLDSNVDQSYFTDIAAQNGSAVGWQTNKHAETGAGCNGGGAGSCAPDSASGPFYQLIAHGAASAGHYLEVWSADVVAYPAAFAAADAAGMNAPNYQGLWFNPNESGWGINFAHQSNQIFASWFTYDLTGKGTWLVMTASKTSANSFAGQLLQGMGPAFDAVPFPPLGSPGGATISGLGGTATITFTDESHATFAYTLAGIAQTKAITRELFGPQPFCVFGGQPDLTLATNYTDLWWASPAGSEAGWGINLTHQGNIIFATWFTFDHDHTPLWMVVQATQSAPGVYSGPQVYRLSGPAFNAVPFPAIGSPGGPVGVVVGSAMLSFANGNVATFNYTVDGETQSKTITREVFASPGTTCD